jgi:hypothetical protein
MAFEHCLLAIARLWVSIIFKPLHRDSTSITPEWLFSPVYFDFSAPPILGYPR